MSAGRWISCCECKEQIWMEEAHEVVLRRTQQLWHCLWGHAQHFPKGQSEAEKLRQERDRLKQQTAQLQDEIGEAWAHVDAEKRRAAAARGQVTKLKKRAANGVCPCCNRTFANLQRHMATKHAGFVAEEAQGAVGQTIQ
jgi:septal ring factor EnvC (AmiA/AmiB activator)